MPSDSNEVGLGLLPFSHIYGLVVIALVSMYHGDSVVVLPNFEMKTFLSAIERFKISNLSLVSTIHDIKFQESNTDARFPQSSFE